MECYFFGTFNPIHLGHIEIARKVQEIMGFSKVIFVPSFMPPHKVDELINFSHRLNMLKLALGESNVSDIEYKLKVPSYTYRTIEKLYEENSNKTGKKEKINFIIGYDQFFKLESWKEPEILKEKLKFIVIPRKFQNGQIMGQKAFEYFKNKGYDFEILNIDFLDVSSTMIRSFIKNGLDIAGLTTKEVRDYIENNRLYSSISKEKSIG